MVQGKRWLAMAALVGMVVAAGVQGAGAQEKDKDKDKKKDDGKPVVVAGPAAADSVTEGSVTVGGQAIAYRAVAGTLTVGANNTQDAMIGMDGKLLPDAGVELPAKPEEQPATARMFYVAYFKKNVAAGEHRPITFAYNGGPGSSTMWLHMGSFGPRRVVTTDTQHDMAAPYTIRRMARACWM